MRRGLLIAFEGLDKTGKTTHSSLLNTALNNLRFPSSKVRFPDRTTQVGKLLDRYLKNQINLQPQVSHMLFSANRWQIKDTMLKNLSQGNHIILDRYIWSGLAYSSALGIDYNWASSMDQGLPIPDITFMMQCPNIQKLQQKQHFGEQRYQVQQFQNKVMKAYNNIIKDYKHFDVFMINSESQLEVNKKIILEQTLKRIESRNYQ